MTRSDILLDTNKIVKEMEEAKLETKHVEEMASILDDLWSVMLTFEKHDELNKIGQYMRKIFYKDNV